MVPLFPRRLRPIILLAAALLLYLAMLGRRDIVTGHEARVAQTARQMAQSWPWQREQPGNGAALRVHRVVLTDIGGGVLRLYPAADGSTVVVNPWLVPVLQGQIRLQKPPLPYWCAAVLLKLFAREGTVEACVRFVPALMGALGVLFVYGLSRRLIGRAGAWAAGLIWIGSYITFDEYRLAMPDPYLAFFTVVCVWAWVRKSPAFPTLLVFYLSLALGMLSKGPLIFLHVGIALAAYQACYRRRVPGRVWQHATGVALLAVLAAPWFIYVYRHVPDAMAIWRYESLGEVSGNTENARAWWFYFPTALAISLPWTPLWAAGLVLPFVRRWRQRCATGLRPVAWPWEITRPRDRQALFPILWYGLTLLFFCFVHQKKSPYLLPALPAQVLLSARAAVALLGHARLTWARRNPRPSERPSARRDEPGYLLGAQAVIGIGFALALPVLFYLGRWEVPLWGMILASGAALAAGILPLWALLRRPATWLPAQAAGYAVLIALFHAGFVTPRDNRRSAKPVCKTAAAMLRGRDTTLLSRWPMLADEAAVYLPMEYTDGARGGVGHRVLMIFDDQEWVNLRRRAGKHAASIAGPVPVGEGEAPERYLRQWDDWIGGGRVVEARRVPVLGEAGDVRWKLFELMVDRKQYAEGGTADKAKGHTFPG